VAWRGPSERDVREQALVLRAMDIEHEVARIDGLFVLLVAPSDAPRALEQLARFRAENPRRAGADSSPERLASGLDAALGWSLLLVAMHVLAVRGAWGLDWESAGVADASAMRAGEWWRAITALTLHADVSHLAGNVLFGAVFLAGLCPFVGAGMAALLCLLAGALGNGLEALVQGGEHLSLGASTAVFGSLGALASQQWRHRVRLRQRRVQRWTPLVMAAILLGYLGTEGVRTDIVAHVTGLLAGLGLGALPWSGLRGALSRATVQWGATALTLALVAGAWASAFAAR